MQIVINIDDEDYENITLTGENTINLGVLLDLREAVRKGTPLPKGHGQLIDGDALLEPFVQHQKDYPNIAINLNFDRFKAIIETAPTIIEADRSEEE